MPNYRVTWSAFGEAVVEAPDEDSALKYAIDSLFELSDIDLESIDIGGVDIHGIEEED